MIISGNSPMGSQEFTTPLIPIEQELFDVEKQVIPILITEKYAPFDDHIPEFAALLDDLVSTSERTNDEIKEVINELKKLIPFQEALSYLMDSSPTTVMQVLKILESKTTTRFFIKFYIEKHKDKSNSFYINFLKLILKEINQLEEQKLWVNRTINSIPLECLRGLFAEMIPATPISELGKLAGLFQDEENARPFVLETIKHYLSPTNPQELCIANCAIFIELIGLSVDLGNPNKPPALTLFLKELDKANNLNTYIIEQLDTYDETSLLLILWTLPPEGISEYVATIDLQDNPYRPAKLLSDLFMLEKNSAKKVSLIDDFTECLSENELQLFVSALVNTDSCVIPYLFAGLNDDQLKEFTENASITLLDKLLRKSVPLMDCEMHWIINHLKTEHQEKRLNFICEHIEFNRLSQEAEYHDNIFIPQYLTLKKLCDMIEAKKDDPDSILQYIKEDIEDTPPLLMALGMHHPECCGQILIASKLLTENQLNAITMSFSEEGLCERLDQLFERLLVDQIFCVLNSLNIKLGAVYTLYKTEQLQQQYHEIVKDQIALKEEMSSLDDNVDLETGIIEHLGRIRKILTPVNLQLRKVLIGYIPYLKFFFDAPPLFSTMIETCQRYSMEIEGPEGYLQQMKNRNSKTHSEIAQLNEVIGEEILQALEFNSLEELNPFGIYEYQDLKALGMIPGAEEILILKKYLSQDELKPIWEFFNTKKFYALSALVESCLLEKSEEAFNLKPLATKLGYMKTEQTKEKNNDEHM